MVLNRLKSVIILLLGLFFIFCAYLQLNDPDSLIWILAYLIPAALSFVTTINFRSRYFQYISFMYLIVALYLYCNNSESATEILNEPTYESLGLALCSMWIYILHLLNNRVIKAS